MSLQILRGLAALMVMLNHATVAIHEVYLQMPYEWTINGGAGVDTFFVLSGFVIEMTIRRFRVMPDGWLDFAWHRIARIAPLYWVLTAAKVTIAAIVPAAMRGYSIVWAHVLASFAFLPIAAGYDGSAIPVLAAGWTLVFEMLFYSIATLSLRLKLPLLRTSGAILIPLSVIALFRPEWPLWLSFYAKPFVLEFLAGIVIARLTMNGWVLSPRAAIITVLAGVVFLHFLPVYVSQMTRLILYGIPGAMFTAGFIGLERFARARSLAPLAVLGDASYAIYLTHTQILAVLVLSLKAGVMAGENPFVILAPAVVFMIAVGVMVFYMFERPVKRTLLRWGISRPAHLAA